MNHRRLKMKKIAYLIVIFLLLPQLLYSCSKQGHPINSQSNSNPKQEQKATPKDSVENEKFETYSDPEIPGAEWVRSWMDKSYAGYDITDIKINYIYSGSISGLFDNLDVTPMLYSVQYSSQKEIPGSFKNSDNTYTFKVLLVAVYENHKTILSGILGPQEFDENDAMLKIYNILSIDSRYSTILKKYPHMELPNEFSLINLTSILKGGNCSTAKILRDNILAIICSNYNEEQKVYESWVYLHNLSTGETYKNIDLGKRNLLNWWVDKEKLILNAQTFGSEDIETIYIDAAGKTDFEKKSIDKENMIYSPDGSKYAYTLKGSLYVTDKNNDTRLIFEGNTSLEEKDYIYYNPYSWLDNSNLIYRIGAYETSFGCGIFNLDTWKDIFFEKAGRYSLPVALFDSKLYILYSDLGYEGSEFDMEVIDLSVSDYPLKKVFKDMSFIDYTMVQDYAFSPDGKEQDKYI
jgi:hypothetical protein